MTYGGGSEQTRVSTLVSPNLDLFIASLEGSGQLLKETTEAFLNLKDIPAKWVAGKQHMRKWAMSLAGQKLKLPAIAFQARTLEIPSDRYNSFAAKKLGFIGNKNSTNDYKSFYKLTPIALTFTTRFVTQDFHQAVKFASTWLMRSENSFSLADDDDFEIRFALNNAPVSEMPEMELDDMGPLFTIECDTHLQTYEGDRQNIPLLKKIKYTINTTNGENTPIKVAEKEITNVDQ